MKERGGADEVGARLEGDTAQRLRLFEVVDAGEVPVGEHRVGQGPEVLGRLQLGGIRR